MRTLITIQYVLAVVEVFVAGALAGAHAWGQAVVLIVVAASLFIFATVFSRRYRD